MNIFGHNFRIEIFGESHGPAIGCILDGVPAGIKLDVSDFETDIARRAPGMKGAIARATETQLSGDSMASCVSRVEAIAKNPDNKHINEIEVASTTSRCENDVPEILSGVYCGRTTGAPLAIVFQNANTRNSDYLQFVDTPRPGHADMTATLKWAAFNDPRGGGHFSGRITLPLVAAGVVAKKILSANVFVPKGAEGVNEAGVRAELVEVGAERESAKWSGLLEKAREEGDSLGGIVECHVKGLPIGLGEPFFGSVESRISAGIFSIPGVRGIEFGDGFEAARMRGSRHNDPYVNGELSKNGAGGINGGLTNGASIVFRVAFKPTSSISRGQQTWNFTERRMVTLEAKGRHDVCFALRTPVIVEAVAAIALADLIQSPKSTCVDGRITVEA